MLEIIENAEEWTLKLEDRNFVESFMQSSRLAFAFEILVYRQFYSFQPHDQFEPAIIQYIADQLGLVATTLPKNYQLLEQV